MAIIHRIGMPENDSEARAIKRLAKGLPDDYFVFHNFEVTTGRGLPYEYDIAVLTPHALYHLEVKGYHGEIRGNAMQWFFENGGVYPSPIPLANKKTKVLAGKLKQYSHRLDEAVVVPGERVAGADEVRVRPQQAHGVLAVEDFAQADVLLRRRRVDVEVVDLQDGERLRLDEPVPGHKHGEAVVLVELVHDVV